MGIAHRPRVQHGHALIRPRLARLGVGLGLTLLIAGFAGCLYMPPPPAGIAPYREGETSMSLHLSADVLAVAQGQSLTGSLGFFPSLRYALNEDQEVIFYPWPAYRHWTCLDGGERRAYHQVSLGSFHPIRSRGQSVGQYVRYDFRVVRARDREDRFCGAMYPEDELSATLMGFWLTARGGIYGRNVMDVTLGVSAGLSSDRAGLAFEPGLLSLLPSARRDGGLQGRWLTEVRAAVWGGR